VLTPVKSARVLHWLYGFCIVGMNYGQWFCSWRQTGENYMRHTLYMAYGKYSSYYDGLCLLRQSESRKQKLFMAFSHTRRAECAVRVVIFTSWRQLLSSRHSNTRLSFDNGWGSQVVFLYRSLIHPHTRSHHDKPFSLSLSKYAFGTSEEFPQKMPPAFYFSLVVLMLSFHCLSKRNVLIPDYFII